MMKNNAKFLVAILLLFVAFSCSDDDSNGIGNAALLINKWKVVSANNESIDDYFDFEEEIEIIISFDENGKMIMTYITIYDLSETETIYGEWMWEDRYSSLQIMSDGDYVIWRIEKLTNDALWFYDETENAMFKCVAYEGGDFIFDDFDFDSDSDEPDNAQGLPIVTTTEVTEISYNSALAGGSIMNIGAETLVECGVYWSADREPILSDSKLISENNTNVFVIAIYDLQPETEYFVKAYAIFDNFIVFGETVSFISLRSEFEEDIVDYDINYGSFTDFRDNNTYKTVKIGSQTWMAENLSYLPFVSPSLSGSGNQPYYYVYGYEGTSVSEAIVTDNYDMYGVLYNFHAALNACPSGWHLPTDEEWKQLEIEIGMSHSEANVIGFRGSDEGESLKAINGWDEDGNGTDEYGFGALPGGRRNSNGSFASIGSFGGWWAVIDDGTVNPWGRGLYNNRNRGVERGVPILEFGLSVRCVMD